MFSWLENKKLMLNTSFTSAVRMKSLLYFYLLKQQMPFLKELKQKAKLARTCPKCSPGASKCKKTILEEAPYTHKGAGPMSHLPRLNGTAAKMGALPSFLVPVITTIVLAISNLNKNPAKPYKKFNSL